VGPLSRFACQTKGAKVDNPLQTNPAREQRVRELAYHLWEADGKPYGRDVEYWERAREQIAQEERAGSAPSSAPDPVRKNGAAAGVQEEPEEFPDALAAEQDEKPAARRAPSRRRKAPTPSGKKTKGS
jgi:Protein of unknown function (DUF2934)